MLEIAREGNSTAQFWTSVWTMLGEEQAPVQCSSTPGMRRSDSDVSSTTSSCPLDLAAARQLHVVLGATLAHSIRSLSHPLQVRFGKALHPQYSPPNRQEATQILDLLERDVGEALQAELCQRVPFCLVGDGANSKGHRLWNVLVVDLYGRNLLLDQKDFEDREQNAAALAALFQPWMETAYNISGRDDAD